MKAQHPRRLSGLAVFFALILLMAACTDGKPSPGRKKNHLDDRDFSGYGDASAGPRSILAAARTVQAEKGCPRAVPLYRAAAGYGRGYEVAQFELATCLFRLAGRNAADTRLLRDEGFFWLKRASWAGNARAQRELVRLFAPGDRPREHDAGIPADPYRALVWALIYNRNPQRDLYALPAIGQSVMDAVNSPLSGKQKEDALEFADAFRVLELPSYIPPAQPDRKTGMQRERPATGRTPPERH